MSNPESPSPDFTRESYQTTMREENEKLQDRKRELGEYVKTFADEERNPNLLEMAVTFIKAMKLQWRVESMRLEHEIHIEGSHEQANMMEAKHQELQQNVVQAMEELEKYEREELGTHKEAAPSSKETAPEPETEPNQVEEERNAA